MTRHRFDPTLYLVTDPELARGRPLTDIVAAAIRGGATMVQLRDKRAGGRALLEMARALKAVLDPLGVPLIVNDRADVAHAAGAAGCHVGQKDLPAAAARAILGSDAILGISIDALEQVRALHPALVESRMGRSPPRRPRRMPAIRSAPTGWPPCASRPCCR
jgi:thiamine-phosphate pyrophosphorylase